MKPLAAYLVMGEDAEQAYREEVVTGSARMAERTGTREGEAMNQKDQRPETRYPAAQAAFDREASRALAGHDQAGYDAALRRYDATIRTAVIVSGAAIGGGLGGVL